MRGRSALRIKQYSYGNKNTICGRELCHLVRVVSLTTGFSLRRDVRYSKDNEINLA